MAYPKAETLPAASLPLDLLRCPMSGGPLAAAAGALIGPTGASYPLDACGIPLFGAVPQNRDAERQQRHYDAIASAYQANLGYPHTRAYAAHLDRVLLECSREARLDTVAEICCGTGEAFALFRGRYGRGVGVDISPAMLAQARIRNAEAPVTFVQGDATRLPLASGAFDAVVMLGGIHHVNDRAALFGEVARILKPGGWFLFREPVSDLFLWRWLRAVVYRLSPLLDHETERPLLRAETEPPLRAAGLALRQWRTCGFLGFCLLMNSDVLVFNRLLRHVPGIGTIARLSAAFDDWVLRLPGLGGAGLQVVGVARRSDTPG